MTDIDDLATEVDTILSLGAVDPEAAHAREDRLLRHLASVFAPPRVQAELTRLEGADFPRWCA